MIKTIKKQIDISLGDFLEKVKREYELHRINPVLYESIKEFSLREGKRIRPLLLILSYKGYAKNNKRLSASFYHAATCIELLHNFMLIHDDIIDRSDLRRGKPTLHRILSKVTKTREQEKLGFDLSIIAGDIVYALAIDAFLSIKEPAERKEKALKYFIQTATFTAMGEFIDTLHSVERVERIKEKDVLLNYTLKTARYTFDCPLVVGAMLAGAHPSDIKKLSQIGLRIGQAFQIQDDILGIFDSQKNIGKSILSDLVESKKTLLVCHAYNQLQGKEQRNFMKYFAKPQKTYRDLVEIRKIFINSGSLKYSLQQIKVRINQVKKMIEKLKIKKSYRRLIEQSLFSPFEQSQKIAHLYRIDQTSFLRF